MQGGRDSGGGSEAGEGDGNVAVEGRKRVEAYVGGEEAGDAGVCIAACKSLASRCRAADESVNLQTTWSPRHESISLGACVSASLLTF